MAKKKNKKKSDHSVLKAWVWFFLYIAAFSFWYGYFTDSELHRWYTLTFAIVLTLVALFHILDKWSNNGVHKLHQDESGRVLDASGNELDGFDYEYHVADSLRLRGYRNVEVTQASGDYGADIICYDKQGNKIAVQCKKYAGSVGIDAVQQVIGAKDFYKCSRAMVITTATFTPAAKNLAEKANVELYERYF